MTTVLVTDGRSIDDISELLSELDDIDVREASRDDFKLICREFGHEYFRVPTLRIEPLKNNETWRGSGKRRKPMCK